MGPADSPFGLQAQLGAATVPTNHRMPPNHKKPSRFPETRWSLVGRAAESDELTRRTAMANLLAAYAPALRAFLVETRRIPASLADDLLQDFIVDKLLARKLVHHADRGRGKFRNLVLKSLNNFVSTKLKTKYAKRTISADQEGVPLPDPGEAAEADRFDREWAQQVVRDTLMLMEDDCEARGRMDLWAVMRLRVVEPMLHGSEPAAYDTIVRELGLATPRQAINLLATAKRSFLRHLRQAVGQYVRSEAEVEQEIADLRELVAR